MIVTIQGHYEDKQVDFLFFFSRETVNAWLNWSVRFPNPHEDSPWNILPPTPFL